MDRIAIIGAGAIGCTLGALLSRAGYEVTLIGRQDQVAAICKNGLRIEGVMGPFVVQPPAFEELKFRPDLALLAVKTQDVLPAVEENSAFLKDIPVVTFQNGVRSDDLVASILPREKIVSAVVFIVASYLSPGTISIGLPGSLTIGHPFPVRESPIPEIKEVLSKAVPTHTSNNIRGAHWSKLLVNLNNLVPALVNKTIQEIYEDPFLRSLSVRVVREGHTVVKRAGIELESLPEISVGLIRLLTLLPVSIAARLTASKVRRTVGPSPVFSSTLQSILRKRPTEVNYLNGEIVNLAKEKGMSAPLNETIVSLVHRVEQDGKFMSVEAIRQVISSMP